MAYAPTFNRPTLTTNVPVDDNGPLWQSWARDVIKRLVAKMGEDAYRAWFDERWPEDAGLRPTWKQIYLGALKKGAELGIY